MEKKKKKILFSSQGQEGQGSGCVYLCLYSTWNCLGSYVKVWVKVLLWHSKYIHQHAIDSEKIL